MSDDLKDVVQLEQTLMAFVRAFGLHQPDQTPCGQPLGVSEAHALAELVKGEGLSQRDLTLRLRLEKSTVSRLVSGLQKRDWVLRQAHPSDGRAYLLVLTEEGRRVADNIAAARRQKFETLLRALPESQRPAVIAALSHLVEALYEEHQAV